MEKKNIIIGPGGDYQWGGMDDTHPADLLKNKAPTIENMRLDKYGVPSKRAGQSEYVTSIESEFWDHNYAGDKTPDEAPYSWSLTSSGSPTAQSDGDICTFVCAANEWLVYTKNPSLSNAAGTTLEVKMNMITGEADDANNLYEIDDGTKRIRIKIELTATHFKVSNYDDATHYQEFPKAVETHYTVRIQLLLNKAMVWVNGELALTEYALGTSSSQIYFKIDGGSPGGIGTETEYDYLKYVATAITPGQDILGLYTHKEPGREELLCQLGGTLWYSKDGSNWDAAHYNLSRNHSIQAVTMYSGITMSFKTYIVNGFNRMLKWNLGSITKMDGDMNDGTRRHPWGRCITAHGLILLVAHNPMYPNAIRYPSLTASDGTPIDIDGKATPSAGQTTAAWGMLQRIDVPEGRGIVGMKTLPIGRDVITLIGMEDICYSLIGNSTDTWDLDKLDANVGCLARDTMQVWKNQIVFLGQEQGKVGVFAYSGSERPKNLSHGANGSIRTILESANIPKFRYWLTNTDVDWDLWTYEPDNGSYKIESQSDDVFGEGYIQIKGGTHTSGYAESPAFYCGNITEWGVLEADWCQQSVSTNRTTIEIKTATTESGLSGESYTEYLIGEKLQETTGTAVWMQIKITLTRNAGGDDTPRFYFMRPTWLDGGEFREIPTAWVHEDSYLLALSDGTSSGNQLALGYGTKYNNILLRMDADGNWTKYTAHNVTCFAEYRSLLLGGYPESETIRQLDTGTQDVSTNFSATYDSPIITVAPGTKARFDHTAYIETKGVTALNVYYKLDQGSWSSAIAVSPTSTNMEATRFTIPAKTYFRNCQMRVEQTTAVSNFEIHKMRFALQVLPGMGD